MQQKTYIGRVNDHSASMKPLRTAAMKDYNVQIAAIKDAATRERQDTIVSVVGVGIDNSGWGTQRQVVISNPCTQARGVLADRRRHAAL